jgi:high-affinity iron transporter
MLQGLLVTFREGVEAFLIIGVIAAYLRKTNRAALLRGVRIGIAVSIVTCIVGAWLWMQVPNQPLYEGIAALAAASFVGLLLWQTLRAGRRLKGQIEARIGRAAGDGEVAPSSRAVAAVALVTALLITREGLEAVFFLGVQAMSSRVATDGVEATLILAGAALGLLLAAAVSFTWSRWAKRLDLPVVLKVTAVFLGLFLVQLLVYGVHELAESGVIHGSQAFHDATEVFGPDGRGGHLLSYSLVGAPLLYLLLERAKRRSQNAVVASPVNLEATRAPLAAAGGRHQPERN